MPLNADRLREQMKVFTWILPYPDSKKTTPMEKKFGFNFKDLMPFVLESLAEDMIENPEATEMYLEWLSHTILYVTEQIDEPAPVECEPIK